MSDNDVGKPPPYPKLPRLKPDEFDALVRTARSRGKFRPVISDSSVAMARAVLLDGLTYRQAALAQGKTLGTAAQQAIKVLMRYMSANAPVVQPHELFRKGETTKEAARPYPDLPHLTREEFDTLVVSARTQNKRQKPVSDCSVAMARAVLVDGATYGAAGSMQARSASAAKHAVIVVLRYRGWNHQVQPHNLFATGTAQKL